MFQVIETELRNQLLHMPPSTLPGLSKSTFIMGRQCSKLQWLRYNAKDQIPAPDEAQQAVSLDT